MSHVVDLDIAVDTTLLVITPEHVRFDFQLAGPFHRLAAYFLDVICIAAIGFAVAIIAGFLGSSGIGVMLFVWFVLFWGYGGLFETLWNGQTPGKRAFGLRVVSLGGLTINAQQAVLRNILRGVDVFPPFFPGLVAMLCSREFQRLGDMAAGTMVIIEGRLRGPDVTWGRKSRDDLDALIPPNFRPDHQLIDVLGSYVGRRLDFSPLRRQDLSGLLAKHFIRAWSLPRDTDTDRLLCAMYRRAVISQQEQDEETEATDNQWRFLNP
ncbi:MAG: domain containing protein [Planctomycetaceae bacterium]|nr:domain containing protein [Planctomycetaceae bacterium]